MTEQKRRSSSSKSLIKPKAGPIQKTLDELFDGKKAASVKAQDESPVLNGTTPSNDSKTEVVDVAEVDKATAEPSHLGQAKPLFPIFTSAKPKARARDPGIQRLRKGGDKPLCNPFPDQDSQHVRGFQTLFSAPPSPLPRRKLSTRMDSQNRPSLANFYLPPDVQDHASVVNQIFSTSFDRDYHEALDSIPMDHRREYPAISNILATLSCDNTGLSTPSQKLWTEKWRPTRAEEVLGNEHHARYLRDWLLALEVQSAPVTEILERPEDSRKKNARPTKVTKRPRVIRAIERGKQRKKRRIGDSEDDWIVDSEETEEEMGWTTGDSDDDFSLKPTQGTDDDSRLDGTVQSSLEGTLHNFGERLTNAILLTGPCGCGKTAAVYACAKELGWEVFEVNPGVGKRSGANLDYLVGDVGKNHLVRKAKLRDGVALMIQGAQHEKSKQRGKSLVMHGGVQDRPILIDLDEHETGEKPSKTSDFGFLATHSGTEDDQDSQPAKARQSLILLEEVDITFKDDHNFWPAVTDLIKHCRRPVVMTCNDLSLIPVDDLALQSIMKFEPCPTPVAASYLQGLCLAERSFLKREFLMQLYESTHTVPSTDLPDVPLNPWTEDVPFPDLRRTINQFQFYSFNNPHLLEPQATLEDLADWGNLGSLDGKTSVQQQRSMALLLRHTEIVSFVDAFVIRPPMQSPLGMALSNCDPSPDDELGHTILFNLDGSSERHKEFPFYFQDEDISQELLKRSRESLRANVVDSAQMKAVKALQARAIFRARVAYQPKLLGALHMIPLSAPLLPRPSVFLDYLPWVRHMVAAEDLFEQAQTKNEKSQRITRSSGRRERMLGISEEDRHALASTALDIE